MWPRLGGRSLSQETRKTHIRARRPSNFRRVSREHLLIMGETPLNFTVSIGYDRHLYRHDIAGSIAHARMLHHVGLLKKKECTAIVAGLEAIGAEIAKGQFEWRTELEDVHMNIEAALTARVPALGTPPPLGSPRRPTRPRQPWQPETAVQQPATGCRRNKSDQKRPSISRS